MLRPESVNRKPKLPSLNYTKKSTRNSCSEAIQPLYWLRPVLYTMASLKAALTIKVTKQICLPVRCGRPLRNPPCPKRQRVELQSCWLDEAPEGYRSHNDAEHVYDVVTVVFYIAASAPFDTSMLFGLGHARKGLRDGIALVRWRRARRHARG